MDTGMHKSKYNWADVSWRIKIKVKGDNIEIIYTMINYKLKVRHDE